MWTIPGGGWIELLIRETKKTIGYYWVQNRNRKESNMNTHIEYHMRNLVGRKSVACFRRELPPSQGGVSRFIE